jgi:hypothetical protein
VLSLEKRFPVFFFILSTHPSVLSISGVTEEGGMLEARKMDFGVDCSASPMGDESPELLQTNRVGNGTLSKPFSRTLALIIKGTGNFSRSHDGKKKRCRSLLGGKPRKCSWTTNPLKAGIRCKQRSEYHGKKHHREHTYKMPSRARRSSV